MADFKIEGLDELIHAFAKLPEQAMEPLKRTAQEGANMVLSDSKNRVISEAIRCSLRTKKQRTKDKYNVEYNITWGDEVREYAAPLELGHAVRRVKKGPVLGYVQERPYLRPAADANRERVLGMMVDTMNKTLEEMGGKK